MSWRVEVAEGPPPVWEAVADAHGACYHHPEWVAGIARLFRFPMACLTAWREDRIAAILPLARVPALLGPARLVSYPFSYAAGVIGDEPGAGPELAARAIGLVRAYRAGLLELKSDDRGAPAPGLVRVDRYHAYRLSLAGGEEAIWARLDRDSTRRSIQKARKSKLAVETIADTAGWRAMAEFQEDTARRHGVPPPPRRFFTELVARLAERGLARGYLAVEDRPVAGVVLWRSRRRWIHAFGGARADRLALRPNHLLLWTAIGDALRAGAEVFDLGRAAPEQEGLVTYKRRWGAEPTPLAYDYWPAPRGLNLTPRDRGPLDLAARLVSRLPTAVTRLGAPLYRYLG